MVSLKSTSINLKQRKKEFTEDGWFKTGDMMLGRTSVDIIKSGGYKISALQIETQLLAHPDIKDCAVVGISDDVWAAVVVVAKGSNITLDSLRKWAENKIPKYSLPTVLKVVEKIHKNAMGKVNKKDLVKNIFK
ncbi:hypothetical protein NQ317_010035 [Molorchus minor]|uniref:AMP-binding enzyme C-terminal domain-containing protein n=1 Tax=Molorchus minor TaxID=1323400 RepID=A0ABQ9J7F5_9CUCU|nr:hypothetical protein NQ317_010035 [Molorchus minor]